MFNYLILTEGATIKAMSIIDDSIRYLISSYEGNDLLPTEVDYSAYMKNFSSYNKKILYKIIN